MRPESIEYTYVYENTETESDTEESPYNMVYYNVRVRIDTVRIGKIRTVFYRDAHLPYEIFNIQLVTSCFQCIPWPQFENLNPECDIIHKTRYSGTPLERPGKSH